MSLDDTLIMCILSTQLNQYHIAEANGFTLIENRPISELAGPCLLWWLLPSHLLLLGTECLHVNLHNYTYKLFIYYWLYPENS